MSPLHNVQTNPTREVEEEAEDGEEEDRETSIANLLDLPPIVVIVNRHREEGKVVVVINRRDRGTINTTDTIVNDGIPVRHNAFREV
jgi:hypothetical protein